MGMDSRRLRRGRHLGGAGARRTPDGVGPVSPGARPGGGAGPEALPAPRPATVPYNDWRQVALPAAETFTPSLPISVIVPCYQAPAALALTLAGLEGQHYPRHLFEVVIVDDGSDPPLSPPPSTPLDVRVVRQERRGFGLARARNTGARAAAHDLLVFLDGDVIAEAGLLAAHARWHHAVSAALTLGFCAYVSVAGVDAAAIRRRPATLRDLFAGRPFDPPWFEPHLARTGELTSRHQDLFRAVTGHNFAMARAFYDEVGGSDESFDRYGGEDTEFGYRVQTRGGLLVPVRDAFAWHQGRYGEGRERKERDQDLQSAKLAHLIAEPGFRRVSPGRSFAVPRHVVSVQAGAQDAGRLVEITEALLADPAGDLVVRLETPPGWDADRLAWLAAHFGPDPRVRVAPERSALDEFPASPLHVTVPAHAAIGPGLLPALDAALGDAVTAIAVLDGGARVRITRAWALHRARRTGRAPETFGDVREVPVAAHARRGLLRRALRSGLLRGQGWRRRGVRAAAARVWAEARHVRGLRTGLRFLRWLAAAARWRLRHAAGAPQVPPSPEVAQRPQAGAPLGAEIATLGGRARAVFSASSRVAHGLAGGHVDVVLADTRSEAVTAAGSGVPVVVLAEVPAFAVPAFDPAVHNPIGWVRAVEPRVAALGPRHLLPATVRAHRVLAFADREALAHCHHLEDVRAFHAGAAERAGTLARLAACGVPIHLADRDPALPGLLGAELHALMSRAIGSTDPAARESLSIALRRAALRGHSLRARARQVCAAALADPPVLPRVSVLLATRRPGCLPAALANVARQRYPHLELVLALHGPGFAAGAVDRALAGFTHPVQVLRAAAGQALGSVLNAATAAAGGTLLAKMDDDDVYGPEHLWDLVLAHEYSGAALVGKFPATVYLARSDRTVRRRAVANETWSRSVTGGAMLLARADLERAGGWRRVRRYVDEALIDDVIRSGGGIYRTHDAGYVLVRHGDRHTWAADDAEFLAHAETVRPGWQPALAGIGDVPRPATVTVAR